MKPFYEQEITQDTIYAALGRLKEKVYTKITELDAEFSASEEPVSFTDRLNLNYRRIQPGEKWGGLFDCRVVSFHGPGGRVLHGKKARSAHRFERGRMRIRRKWFCRTGTDERQQRVLSHAGQSRRARQARSASY